MTERIVFESPDDSGESCVTVVDRRDEGRHHLWLLLCEGEHFDVLIEDGEDGAAMIAAMTEEMLSLERRLAEARARLVDYAVANRLI